MDDKEHGEVSRRSVFKSGITALGGIAIISVTGRKAWAADKKLSKSMVIYVDASKNEGKDCDDCIYFVAGKTADAPGSCKIVEGEISPHGYCIRFQRK
jgi:hypothetical protein